ncbi:UNVERIFIED_CONTAM: hypothetical protein RMT77_012071 [Armadillidium vulgare]
MQKEWQTMIPTGSYVLILALLHIVSSISFAATSAVPKDIDDAESSSMDMEDRDALQNTLLLHLLPSNTDVFSAYGAETITIPPSLIEGPPKGELLFRVTHDPEKEPENLTIPCKADGLPLPTYFWFKDGAHFNMRSPNVKMSDSDGTLVFPDPQPEDEGDYQCVATNSAGSVYSDIASVRRAITISFPKGEPRVVTAYLGQPLALKCDNPGGYPVPSLHWVLQKSDGSLRSVSSERATVDDEGTLWFGTVTLEDASEDALYACAASSATSLKEVFVVEGSEGKFLLEDEEPNEGSYVSLSLQSEYRMGNWVYLNVTSLPRGEGTSVETEVEPFLQYVSDDEITALKGEDVKIYCIYGGHPMPNVRWWREDGNSIPVENIVEFGKALQILEIKKEDAVTYMCEASNEAGEGAVHSFDIKVESVPEFEEEPGFINQPPGLSATFRCSSKGVPEPVIAWSFNGEPLQGQNDETLTYDSLTLSDKGVIACNASNKHGYAYSTGFLNVLSIPPEFTKQPEDISGFMGKKLALPCEAYGSPDPKITWWKSEDENEESFGEVKDGEQYQVSNKYLIINSVSDETEGTYKCKASNKYGTVETIVNVKLIKSTEVSVELSSDVVKAGDTVTIKCDVTVDEMLSADVTWVKDDSPLDFSNERISSEKGGFDKDPEDDSYDRILTITKAEGRDSGIYSCVSNTGEDEAEGFVILTVEDVPETPVIQEVECAASEAYVHWVSKGENSSPVTSYRIQKQTNLHLDKWEDTENDIPPSGKSYRVKLTPGLTHVFRVIAINRVGPSVPSAASDPCTAAGAPPDNNPQNSSVKMIDSSTLRVTWNAIEPEEHHGSDFKYVVSWKIFGADNDEGDDDDDEGTQTEEDDNEGWSRLVIEDWEQTETEIEGLRPHTRYLVRVAAENEHGAAPTPEDMLIYTEEGVPERAPTHLRVRRIMDTTAILFWIPVPSNKILGPLVGYEIDIHKVGEEESEDGDDDDDDDEEENLTTHGQTSRVDLSGLEPFTEYQAKVRVVNKKFAGPYTDPIFFQTAQGDSSPVQNLKAKSFSTNSIIVEWEPPEDPNGIITSYIIRYQAVYEDEEDKERKDEEGEHHVGTELETVVGSDENQVKLSGLEENTSYKIQVFARNKGGLGEGSEIQIRTEKTESSIPVPPVFSWEVVESEVSTTTLKSIVDRDNDNDVDDIDRKLQNVILTDVDGDGDVDKDDILDTDSDGDIDKDDFDVADINNDGVVDERDIAAADRDGDGDVDEYDIGDEDGDGDFDAHDVIIADEDGDGDIDAADDNDENVILKDFDNDGDIDEDDAIDVDKDGDIDQDDLSILDVDDDGDIDSKDIQIIDKDKDGDIDDADIVDLDEDGKIGEDDLDVRDIDGDGDIDRVDYVYRETFIDDTDGDGDIDEKDVLDIDRDGDIDEDDIDLADINNDGEVDYQDVSAADRDGDGDVDANDIGDEDKDGDVDAADLEIADEDGDGDIDADDENGEGILFEDIDGDGDLDVEDVTDIDGDGDVDSHDIEILDVNDDGIINEKDLSIIDKDGDGDVDSADVADFDRDGRIDEDDLEVVDKDGDGDIDSKDIKNQHVYLKDVDGDGDIDLDDVLDLDGDGDVDEKDIEDADLDDDGDVDADDLNVYDKDKDGDIDTEDISDIDGDGRIDEDDFDVTDKDGDGDIDEHDYVVRNIFLTDADNDGDIDKDDVLDTDADGDIDKEDFEVADINNDNKVNEEDVKAGDLDNDGDVDIADIGDEDGDGDIDGDDVIAADEDKDGDIDEDDDDGEHILLTDRDKDGDIDEDDVEDVDGDGDIDNLDLKALDIDNDGDVDKEDLDIGDQDKDGDIDAADITDLDGDGDVDGNDIVISDRDGDGYIDSSDRRNKDMILTDADKDGDVDSEDVLDLDKDGDIDGIDFKAADINSDGEVNIEDVWAADFDGDGDVDVNDIRDIDGDGDIDAKDIESADRDKDGDIDRADRGEGVDVTINWRPDIEKNPGSKFYLKYRPVGEERWITSPVEEKSLHQTLRGLDPYSAYEVQMMAKDGEFETPSNITIIGPFAPPDKEDEVESTIQEISAYDNYDYTIENHAPPLFGHSLPEYPDYKGEIYSNTEKNEDINSVSIGFESKVSNIPNKDENIGVLLPSNQNKNHLTQSQEKHFNMYPSTQSINSIDFDFSAPDKEDEVESNIQEISAYDNSLATDNEQHYVFPESEDAMSGSNGNDMKESEEENRNSTVKKDKDNIIIDYYYYISPISNKNDDDKNMFKDYKEHSSETLNNEDFPVIKEYDLPKAEVDQEEQEENYEYVPIEREDRPVIKEYDDLPKAKANYDGVKYYNKESSPTESEDRPQLKEYDDLPKANEKEGYGSNSSTPVITEKEDEPVVREYDDLPRARVHEDKTSYEVALPPVEKEDKPSFKEYEGFPKVSEEYESPYDESPKVIENEDIPSVMVYEDFPTADGDYEHVTLKGKDNSLKNRQEESLEKKLSPPVIVDEYQTNKNAEDRSENVDHPYVITDESDYIPVLYKDYEDKISDLAHEIGSSQEEDSFVPNLEELHSTAKDSLDPEIENEISLKKLDGTYTEENVDSNYIFTDESDYIPVLYKDYEEKPVRTTVKTLMSENDLYDFEGSGDDSLIPEDSLSHSIMESNSLHKENQSIFNENYFNKVIRKYKHVPPFTNSSKNLTASEFKKPLTDEDIKGLFGEHYHDELLDKSDIDADEQFKETYDEFMKLHPPYEDSISVSPDDENETLTGNVLPASEIHDYDFEDYKHYEDKFKEIGLDAWGNEITHRPIQNVSKSDESIQDVTFQPYTPESVNKTDQFENDSLIPTKKVSTQVSPVLIEVPIVNETTSEPVNESVVTVIYKEDKYEKPSSTSPPETRLTASIISTTKSTLEKTPILDANKTIPAVEDKDQKHHIKSNISVPILTDTVTDPDENDLRGRDPIHIGPTPPYHTNTTETPMEEPTVGAVMEHSDPTTMTWFIVAVIVAVLMLLAVLFSVWVYNKRLSRVSELRAQLYEGYEPPPVVEKEKKAPDVEAAIQENEVDEAAITAEKQRQQMSALLKRQETVQSVDSFASHDDDFAEYGDETMAIDLLNSVSLIPSSKQQGHQPKQ